MIGTAIPRSGRNTYRNFSNCQIGASMRSTRSRKEYCPSTRQRFLPAYEVFRVEKEEYDEILRSIVFGRKYLRERKLKEAEKKVEEKPILKEGEKPRNLEETVATMPAISGRKVWATVGTNELICFIGFTKFL